MPFMDGFKHQVEGENLGDGCEIEKRCRAWLWRRDVVREVTEGTKDDKFALVGHADRGCRKGVRCDCIFQDAKGGCEALVLIVEGSDRSGFGQVQIQKNGPRLRL